MVKHKTFKVGSLFAGVGGIDLAFQKTGFKLLWANEIDSGASSTLQTNFKHQIFNCDIKEFSAPHSVDVIVAGFPCQAFSIAGYQKGFKDTRGSIFFEMMRVIKSNKPSALFLENVKHLLGHNNGKTMSVIIKELKQAGYYVKYKILNTYKYSNIPQNRERLYIVGFRKKSDLSKFEFPKKVKNKHLIRDLLMSCVDDNFYYNDFKYYDELEKNITNKDTCYQWRRKYVRENKNNLCPTLTANMGTGGHNVPLVLDDKGIRKLTPRECFKFQGFPSSFKLPKLSNSKLYKQAGNSVSVPVVKKIANNIFKVLNG